MTKNKSNPIHKYIFRLLSSELDYETYLSTIAIKCSAAISYWNNILYTIDTNLSNKP
jgi:hypothetical protein